ncbi:MAG: glycoside hydrolase family 26 protein [Prevotella sp.]|nr:glycoside hydrolase family 26 protein [Prevotella sp.]MCH3985244.1 glycoside hydrolase family 26 protein [Prevotella sp.]MCH4099927.1 glycoside hydrolase family 26 protein [Prevotella sp.]MCH4216837.1 glycoside hydrolase family 26 protein [Prevotella sp.]MCH4251704.1 glycoside hydrolase family 26 protein [Prevotella sp.]
MMTYKHLWIIAVCGLFACRSMAASPAEKLIKRLQKIEKKGVMIGHQDDPMYGTTWKWEYGRSDVKETCGDYPALMGFELGHLELDSTRNLDGVPFDQIRQQALAQYNRGGVVEISWHSTNPVTMQSAWDPSGRAVSQILPGGKDNPRFMSWLSRVGKFLLSIRTADGKLVPLIFRPWHEMSGGWFWWGKNSCTPDEYQQLYRLTVRTLRGMGLDNLVFCYSPGGTDHETEENFMQYYPGDRYVDMMGADLYGNDSKETYIRQVREEYTVISRVAAAHHKLMCFAETGSRNTPDPQWFTTGLWKAIQGFRLSYVLLWRNAWDQPKENFGPAPDKSCAADFRVLYSYPTSLFLNDMKTIR